MRMKYVIEIFLAGFTFTILYGETAMAMAANKTTDPSCDVVTSDNPAIPSIISKKMTATDKKKYAFFFQRKYTDRSGSEKKLIFKVTSDDVNEAKQTLYRRLDKESKGLNWLMEKNLGEKPTSEPPQMIAWPSDENDLNNKMTYHYQLREKFCMVRRHG